MAEQLRFLESRNILKNPFNYQGGKDKLITQLLERFPSKIHTFVDLFCGSGIVALNASADKYVCYDKCKPIIDIINSFRAPEFINAVDTIICAYNLSKTNAKGFYQLREMYNQKKFSPFWDSCRLYALICHTFNNQFAFNKSGGMNVPFGLNRSSFNENMRNKLELYIERLLTMDATFEASDFRDADCSSLTSDDFVYVDSPYLITIGGYERDFSLRWNEDCERDLLAKMDELNSRGVKFGLSNVFTHKGKTNNILISWAEKYNVDHLNMSYGNCNYQTHTRDDKKSDEVYVYNYDKATAGNYASITELILN